MAGRGVNNIHRIDTVRPRTCECANPIREDDRCVRCGKTLPGPQMSCHCGAVFPARLTPTGRVACPDPGCDAVIDVAPGVRLELLEAMYAAPSLLDTASG